VFGTAPPTVNAAICAYDDQPITLTPPTVTSACDPANLVLRGEVISSNGQPVVDPKLPVVSNTVTVPPGSHMVRWTASDSRGNRATLDQTLTVDTRLTVTQNVYDGPEWWGTIKVKNTGSSAVTAYRVEFNVAPGVHCTNDYVPPGATLSPLSGSGSTARTVSNHCVFTWANGPSIAAGATKTFNYSTDSQASNVPTEVAANQSSCVCVPETNAEFCSRLGRNCGATTALDNCRVSRSLSSCGTCASPLTCGGGGIANICGGSALKITKNVYDGSEWWGTITFKNVGTTPIVGGYRVEFDVPSGVHCTAEPESVPPGSTLTPLTTSGNPRRTVSNHCIFTWQGAPDLAAGASVTFNYSTDSQNFSSASQVVARDLLPEPL
jgi:hypothetical protein